jgi:serine protease Do
MKKTAFFLLLLPWMAVRAPAQVAEARALRELVTGSSSYLGVNVAEVDADRARALKLKEERGVEIKRVQPDSPAEKAGLKENDVVLEYNGQRVEGTESFIRMVRETPVGRTAKMQVSRDGNLQTLTATIGQRKDGSRSFSLAIPPIPPIPPVPHIDVPRSVITLRTPRVGLETESLSGQLAEFFGVNEGVLVRSVDKDSPAEKAGFKAGDVITKVDGRTVNRPRDVSDELRGGWDKKTVPVQVMRSKKELTLNLELPERSQVTPRRGRTVRLEQERL